MRASSFPSSFEFSFCSSFKLSSMGEDGLDVLGDAARSSFVLLEGFDAFAMIWFFLIVIPESWKFVMVVTSRSFLATARGMANSFLFVMNCSSGVMLT